MAMAAAASATLPAFHGLRAQTSKPSSSLASTNVKLPSVVPAVVRCQAARARASGGPQLPARHVAANAAVAVSFLYFSLSFTPPVVSTVVDISMRSF